MNWFTAILLLLGAHYVADFPLQGDFVAQMKGKRLYILFAHGVINAFIISLVLVYLGVFASWKFIVIAISHMVIDKWKSQKPKDDAHWYLIYYDQIGHILINIILLFV